jgi:hypothetical protein
MSRGPSRDLLAILLLALAPLAAYAPALREGRLLAPGDGEALHLPLRVEAWRALQRGEIPSWNPGSFSGTPLLASYRPGALHPLMAALAPLPPMTAFQILVLLSLALAAVLTFFYGRRLGAGRLGAGLAGIGFALGPYLVAQLGDTATLVAAPCLPLVLLAAEAHLAGGGAKTSAALAISAAFLLLAGSPDAVGAGALLLAARLAVRAGEGGAGVRSVLSAVAAGALLAAPQLLPTLIALREAGPGGAGAAATGPAVLSGVSGFVVRYASHTPAPALALAAVPLLATRPALKATGAVAGGLFLMVLLRGGFERAGAVPLAFDLALALLAGLSLTAQREERGSPRGRALRLLFLITALASAAALSIATTVVGPLPETLGASVGLLAIGLILYFRLADSTSRVVPAVFALPVFFSFLMQPYGREAWREAPTREGLLRGGPTREAIDRRIGARREERTLTLATSWPHGLERELLWANLAGLAGRHAVEGYDPMAPLGRRRVLDLASDGTVQETFFAGDPGRLELLGVRFVQVPTASLAVTADANGLGEAIDLILEPGRPRLLALPIRRATEVVLATYLSGAIHVAQGEIVGECVVRLAAGREVWFPLRAGIETAEWAIEREDVRPVVRHRPANVLRRTPTPEGFAAQEYLARLPLPGRFFIDSLRLRSWPGAPPLTVLRAGVRDAETGHAAGVSALSGFLSEEARLAEAAATPAVRLVEVRRGIGRAWVVESLRRVPDEARVLALLGSPTRLGVDPRRVALAVESDVEGVSLPAGSRSSPAALVGARGGRLVLRAVGPGLLVVGEGWDPGWTARIDGQPARTLRVNADRIGVVLAEGPHRVVLVHQVRGLEAGVALALAAAGGLLAAALRERRRRGAV